MRKLLKFFLKTDLPILRRPYQKLIRFKNGIDLGIYLTWRCNCKCSYCPVPIKMASNFDSKELTSVNFYHFIKNFPIKIRQITLSGGEPTLKEGLSLLINNLLNDGYFVGIFTNMLNPKIFDEIKPSPRFMITTNYHVNLKKEIFLKNVRESKHQILIGEFEGQSNLSSKFKKRKLLFNNEFDTIYRNTLFIDPYGRIFTTCFGAIKANKITYENTLHKP